ncbi:unnamed protein product [Closterium sp. NIES-65]|nr:unnamed protein product [Closterium sp. NIES-65]
MALELAAPTLHEHLANPRQAAGREQEWGGCDKLSLGPQELGLRGLASWEEVAAKVVASDGHSWLKYGRKKVRHSGATRCYYKCSMSKAIPRCPARKTVDINCPGSIHVTYRSRLHNHPVVPNRRSPYYHPDVPVSDTNCHVGRLNLPELHGVDGSAAPDTVRPAASGGELKAVVHALRHESVGVIASGNGDKETVEDEEEQTAARVKNIPKNPVLILPCEGQERSLHHSLESPQKDDHHACGVGGNAERFFGFQVPPLEGKDGLVHHSFGAPRKGDGNEKLEHSRSEAMLPTPPRPVVVAAVSGGCAAMTDGCASVTDGCAPVTDGSAPVADGFAPVTDGSAPVADGSAPVTDGSAPVADGSAPVADGCATKADGCAGVTDGRSASHAPGLLAHWDALQMLFKGNKPDMACVLWACECSSESEQYATGAVWTEPAHREDEMHQEPRTSTILKAPCIAVLPIIIELLTIIAMPSATWLCDEEGSATPTTPVSPIPVTKIGELPTIVMPSDTPYGEVTLEPMC